VVIFQEEAMKKMLLISCVMLALAASAALAGGLNISWSPTCASDGLTSNLNFACTVNSGGAQMLASFAPTEAHEFLLACDAVIDGQASTGTVIPNWWQFKNTGACRINELSAVATGWPLTGTHCVDTWGGQATASVDYYGDPVWNGTLPVPIVSGIRARFKIGVSVGVANASPVDAAVETYAFGVNLTYKKTVGSAPCAGCSVPMAFVFNSIMPGYQDGTALSSETITTVLSNGCITWQGANAPLCGATPAQNKTWGQVKSLYR
jgi:hypothetical protein